MAETIVQMTPMLILGGLIAGWLAEAASRASGFGFISDVVLGLVGSLIAGAFVWLVIWRDASMTTMLFVGCLGAALAIIGQRGVWPSARVATAG
jgi:uncharacterized membrane protein YeaQ/YmgE (transglycosylase-associated protein family)